MRGGAPLLPADLFRNFIFLRAARSGEEQEALYDEYWSRFDDPFWRKAVKQGRLLMPRSDLFIQHFLASQKRPIFLSGISSSTTSTGSRRTGLMSLSRRSWPPWHGKAKTLVGWRNLGSEG